MADIDEVSRLLGVLTTQNNVSAEQIATITKQFDMLREDLSEIKAGVNETVSKVNHLEERIDEDIEPTVEDFKKLKQRGIGVITFVGISGGVFGSTIKDFIARMLS